MKSAVTPNKKPVPTTTIVSARLSPTPTGPSQFGASVTASAGCVVLPIVTLSTPQAAMRPAKAGLLPTTGEGCLMFLATRKLNMHCSQPASAVSSSYVQKQAVLFCCPLQVCISWIGDEQDDAQEVTASTLGKSMIVIMSTCVILLVKEVKNVLFGDNCARAPTAKKPAKTIEVKECIMNVLE